jgi:addiction module RelB/DinJ family antitoxin
MAQQFIHVRVDSAQKKDAEKVLNSLGLTMTTGIHLFLNSVIRNKGLPFEIKQSRGELLGDKVAEMERRFQKVVARVIDRDRADGHPIALYDKVKKCPYLEYPDGRREYADG